MTLAFISLGPSIAPERHLYAAVREIAALGGAAQPRFVNGAVLLPTGVAGWRRDIVLWPTPTL